MKMENRTVSLFMRRLSQGRLYYTTWLKRESLSTASGKYHSYRQAESAVPPEATIVDRHFENELVGKVDVVDEEDETWAKIEPIVVATTEVVLGAVTVRYNQLLMATPTR